MAVIFFILVSKYIWNDLHTYKINTLDILVYSSSKAVLGEPIVGWEVGFV